MKAANAAPPLNDAANAAMLGRVLHFASLGVRFCSDGSWTYTCAEWSIRSRATITASSPRSTATKSRLLRLAFA